MKRILEIKNLTKFYGKTKGIENLSLTIQEGEILGFIGPNGAGKSTTIRCIMGLIFPLKGDIFLFNKRLAGDESLLKEQVGYLPSEISLYDDLTVQAILDYHETFYSKNIHQRREQLVKLFQLDERKKIEDLSLGNLKKLGIILAFVHEPKLVILDEPTSGLDPIMQQVFYNFLKEEKKRGTTIFYSTHILNEVAKICDRVGIIKDGHLITVESVKDYLKKQFSNVTIESNDIDQIIKELHLKEYEKTGIILRFRNTFSINELIFKLTKFNIVNLYIEEASLEDVFLHYYE